ncbi:MAG: phosphatase PAP2 family protein [Syntrophobacteraceae bacterium]
MIHFLNGFSRVSENFDSFLALIRTNHLLKGGILITILWWFWFQDNKQSRLVRERIVLTLVSCFIALFLARILAYTLPFRVRPMHNPILHFNVPYGIKPTTLDSWSSFPSDHAVLFFALATGILFISRKIGILAIAYVLVVICFPRVYLGLHYPTDILCGALIGIGIVWLVIKTRISKPITQTAMRWLNKEPASFYACFFLLTYQIAAMFEPIRAIGSFIGQFFCTLFA